MSGRNQSNVYQFAGFTVDVTRRQLLCDRRSLPLTSKAFDTLLVLIRHRGETVSKADLMNAVWADTAVEENNLTQQISALRRAFGERPDHHRFIVTVPGRGYSFVAALEDEGKTTILASHRRGYFDSGRRRGYALAFSYMALIGLSFVWSSLQPNDAGRPRSLAVMNFKASASGDEFIGDGISNTLRARLGSVQDLTVRPASSADQDALAAGRRLEVDAVVTGSVQRDHDRIRVAVEMLSVADGRIVWGKTFDDAASNLFGLQDSIAVEVARVLNVTFAAHRGQDMRSVAASFQISKLALKRSEIIAV